MNSIQSKRLTRSQSIKKYCREVCCAGQVKDVTECPSTTCPLYRFRTGFEIRDELYKFSKRNENFSKINPGKKSHHLNGRFSAKDK